MSDTGKRLRAVTFVVLMVVWTFSAPLTFGTAYAAANFSDNNEPVVFVTAGGNSQEPVGVRNTEQDLVFAESGAGNFPSTGGTATLEISGGSNIEFDYDGSTPTVSASPSSSRISGNVEVASTEPQRIVVDVEATDLGETERITLSNVNFSVPDTAGNTKLTWTFETDGGIEVYQASGTISPERMAISMNRVPDLRRGASGEPSSGVGNVRLSSEGLHSDGFVGESNSILIRIPSSSADDLSFDSSASDVSVNIDGTCNLDEVAGTPQEDPSTSQFVDENTFEATINCNQGITRGTVVSVSGFKFQTTGVANADADARLESGLSVSYEPRDFNSRPDFDTVGNRIRTVTPTTILGPNPGSTTADEDNTLTPGLTGTAGNSGTGVVIRDDADSPSPLVGTTRVVISAPENPGVTFDEGQTIEVARSTVDQDNFFGEVRSKNENRIVIEITEQSADGESIIIGSSDGSVDDGSVDPLKFDVAGNAQGQDLDLTVKTRVSAASENVTQATDNGEPAGNVRDIDIAPPPQFEVGNGDPLFANDKDGETGISDTGTLTLTSQGARDIASTAGNTQITYSIPEGSGVTFSDFSPTVSGDFSGATAARAGNRRLTVRVPGNTDASPGDTLTVENVGYDFAPGAAGTVDLQYSVDRTGVSGTATAPIEVEQLSPEDTTIVVSDEQPLVGSTQSATVTVTGNAAGFDGGADANLGGEEVDLTISGPSADASLSETRVTTGEDGTAGFDITVGTDPGEYDVTATSVSEPSVSTTTTLTVPPRPALAVGNDGADFANDADGETGVSDTGTLTLTSQGDTDIASTAGNTQVTVTIPENSGVTFGEFDPTVGTDFGADARLAGNVGDRSLTVEIGDSADAQPGDTLTVGNVNYDLAAGTAGNVALEYSIDRNGIADSTQDDIGVEQLSPTAVNTVGVSDATPVVGTTQTATIEVVADNADRFDGGADDGQLGGERVDLAIANQPSGADASLGATRVTTAADGTATVDITVGNAAGTYDITATSATDSALSTTVSLEATGGEPATLRVERVEDALVRESGTDPSPTDAGNVENFAIYEVTLEDANGNPAGSGTSPVDLSITRAAGNEFVSGDEPVVFTGIDSSTGAAAGSRVPVGNDGTAEYDFTADDSTFYVYHSSGNAGTAELQFAGPGNRGISGAAGAATFSETPAVRTNVGTLPVGAGNTLAVSVTVGPTSDRPVSDATVDITGVAGDRQLTTDASGTVSTSLTPTAVGNVQVAVSDANAVGNAGVTVPSRPDPDLDGTFSKDPDGDGRYEDVNGDGSVDIVDVDELFREQDRPTVTEAESAFDFNGDGGFDNVDVDRLFELTK